jgi:RNA polymerase sigma-70 factor (ECF subfamily)
MLKQTSALPPRCSRTLQTMTHDLATSLSLLGRLKHAAQNRDWEDFYDRYSPVILSFAQKCGLDFSGAEDVLQETVICLIQKLPNFEYDPRKGKFRNWLRQIVKNKAREQLRRSGVERTISMSESALGWQLDEAVLREDPAQLISGLDQAWEQSVLEQALRRIRADPTVKKETYEIFLALTVAEESIVNLEARFGIKRNAIYQIKSRMQKRLLEEMASLAGGETSRENLT